MQPTESRSPGKYLDRRVIPSSGRDRQETGQEGGGGETPSASLFLKWLRGAILKRWKLLIIRCFRVCDMIPVIILIWF